MNEVKGLYFQITPNPKMMEFLNKPIAERMKYYAESIRGGVSLLEKAFTSLQEEANIKETNKIINEGTNNI